MECGIDILRQKYFETEMHKKQSEEYFRPIFFIDSWSFNNHCRFHIFIPLVFKGVIWGGGGGWKAVASPRKKKKKTEKKRKKKNKEKKSEKERRELWITSNYYI